MYKIIRAFFNRLILQKNLLYVKVLSDSYIRSQNQFWELTDAKNELYKARRQKIFFLVFSFLEINENFRL